MQDHQEVDRVRSARQVAGVTLVVALALAAGCSSSSGDGDTSLGEQTLSDLSALETRALTDKTVTYAELEEAGQAFTECLEGSGFATFFEGTDRGPGSVVAEIASPAESLSDDEAQVEQDRQDAAYDGCLSEVSAVSAVWVLQNQASEDEIQAALDDLPDCLARAGVQMAPDSTAQEAVAAAAEFRSAPSSSETAITAVDVCLSTTASATESAQPGLAEALAGLDLRTDG